MDRAGYETLKSGMEKEFGADRVRCYNGHEVGTAVSLAENADIIVLALGGSSSRFKGALFDENGAAKVQGVLEMDWIPPDYSSPGTRTNCLRLSVR